MDRLFALHAQELQDSLAVRIDRGAHGLVEPTQPRPLPDFEADLASTRGKWRQVEPAER